MGTRSEHDPLGPVTVPADAYYGAQTARAITNFPLSGLRPDPALVWATLQVKRAAALANRATGRLESRLAAAIVSAADEALAGGLADQFLVDPFQAGAGTSHNMNVNEVLANRAGELLGEARGSYRLVHPNDHVNMAQSTNDVFPTAMRLACLRLLERLLPELEQLAAVLAAKGEEFDGILKAGRTHLQDAVPIRLGQEFAAYGRGVARSRDGLLAAMPALQELGLGGTAVGTGLNAEPRYQELVVAELAAATGWPLTAAADRVEAMQNMAPFLALSAALRGVAVTLIRIANDLRLLASGPRTGLGEIVLPAIQPGSSIMPGKVNPSLAEAMDMVGFQVLGADTVVTLAVQAGQLELNVMMPVIAHNLLFPLGLLSNTVRCFRENCVAGIQANAARCRAFLEASPALVTALAPSIGYGEAAKLAKEAEKSGQSVRQLLLEQGRYTAAELDRLLDPYKLTTPGVPEAE